MDKDIKLLKVAGILNLAIGIIFLVLSVSAYAIFSLVLGIIVIAISDSKEIDIIRSRKKLIFIGILSLLCCRVSAVLIFIFCDKISEYERYVNSINAPPESDKESKKIDILLKLGVGMVLLSGILFATTSWQFITDGIKVISLIVLATLFLGLSLFTEKKLKLYKTSYMYWLLSISFYTLTIVGLQYFGVIGSYLTYSGAGSKLAYFITCLVIGMFTYISYLKYNKSYLAYLSYLSIILAIFNILSYIKLDNLSIVGIISVILLTINIITKDNSIIKAISKIASYIIVVFVLSYSDDSNMLMTLLVSIVNLVNLNYLVIKNKEKLNIISLIESYILIICGLSITNPTYIITYAVITIYTALISINIFGTNDKYKLSSYIIYSILSLVYYIMLVDNQYYALLVPAIYLLFNILSENKIYNFTEEKLAKYLNPIPIFFISLSTLTILSDYIDISDVYVFLIPSLVYCLLSLIKDKEKVYQVSSLIMTFIAIIINAFSIELVPIILTIISPLYIFIINFKNNNNKGILIISYLILLTSIYSPFVDSNIFDINIYFINIIFIWLLIFIIILIDNKYIKIPTYFYIILPILALISSSDISNDIQKILVCTLYLYITFLIIKFLVKEKNAQISIGIIGVILSILLSEVLFISSSLLFIYIGLVSLILIIIGYKFNDYYAYFIFGVILTILNVIIRLKDVWLEIPAWLYLLLVGLGIIIVVTYIQMKKQK